MFNRYGLFQSASVIADGRTFIDLGSRGTIGGFNPRPSLLTDEPFYFAFKRLAPKVSIRVRHC